MPEHTPSSPLTLPADSINQPPQVWLDLIGQSYLERGLTKEAIQVLQMNVEAHPTSPTAHRSLGRAYERSGEIELSAMSFQQASALHTA